MNKKIIAGIVIVVALIAGYNVLFSDSSFEKDLKESLPYELKAYTLFDSDYAEYNLQVKDFTIDRHIRNGNYDTADCTVVLEDENLMKTVYITLYSTKYNTGWQVERYTENQAVVVPKYAPDEGEIELELSAYMNYTVNSENFDYSSGFCTRTYSINDVYDYATFTGEVTVEAEFVEEDDNDISSYGWEYSSENDINVEWTVKGLWNMEWNDGNISYLYRAQKTVFNIYENLTEIDGLLEYTLGDAVCYHYPFDESKDASVYEDDDLVCDMQGYNPYTATLTVKSNCVKLVFTCDSCEAYTASPFYDEVCQSVIRK